MTNIRIHFQDIIGILAILQVFQTFLNNNVLVDPKCVPEEEMKTLDKINADPRLTLYQEEFDIDKNEINRIPKAFYFEF